jgi:hypothetical protein
VVNSVYGEKQAGRIWYEKNDDIMISKLGFTRCPSNPNLYYRITDTDAIYIVVHVDDGFISATSQDIIDEFVSGYKKHVTGITLWERPIKKYLGIDLTETASHIHLSQKNYLQSTVIKDVPPPKRPIHTPMSETVNLRKSQKNPENPSLLPDTGKLRFLADRTRPDILNVTGELANGGDKEASDLHILTRDRVYSYLHTHPDKSLRLGGTKPVKMFGFVDASYDVKSRIGGALFLGLDAGVFHTFSVSESLTSLSSCEVEIKGIAKILLAVIHFRELLTAMGESQEEPTDIYCDNKSSVEICKILKMTNRTRHIQTVINFIREQINARIINLIFVPGSENCADVLTKALPRETFNRHIDKLFNGFNGDLGLNNARTHISIFQELELEDTEG